MANKKKDLFITSFLGVDEAGKRIRKIKESRSESMAFKVARTWMEEKTTLKHTVDVYHVQHVFRKTRNRGSKK